MIAIKKVLSITVAFSIVMNIFICHDIKIIRNVFNSNESVKAGVLLYSLDDEFSLRIKRSLEKIQNVNENKMQFSFFDGKGNLAIEDELLSKMIKDDFDIIIATLVDIKEQDIILKSAIDKTKEKNLPFILYNSFPSNLGLFKNNQKTIIIDGDNHQAGVLQGQMIAKVWNDNKKNLDKNKDNKIQYVAIRGKTGSVAADLRTKDVVATINNYGIETQELAAISADWEKELANRAMEAFLFRLDNKIEVVISNNDNMAIGAIEAFQKYGYNKDDKSKYIAVFGIDGLLEAQELIKNGYMSGTVLYDFDAYAKAVYDIGMNLVSNMKPLEGTNYKFDETGVRVLIQYQKYITKDNETHLN